MPDRTVSPAIHAHRHGQAHRPTRPWPDSGQYGPVVWFGLEIGILQDGNSKRPANHRPDTGALRACQTALYKAPAQTAARIPQIQTHLSRCVPANYFDMAHRKRSPLRLVLTAGSPRCCEHTHVRTRGNMAMQNPLCGVLPGRNRRLAKATDGPRPDQKKPFATSHSASVCAEYNSRFRFEKINFSARGLTEPMPTEFRVPLNLLLLTFC